MLRGGLPGLEVDRMQTAIYAEERMFRRYAFLLSECDHGYGTLREGQVSYGCKKDALRGVQLSTLLAVNLLSWYNMR
jgi:hypothetical protein